MPLYRQILKQAWNIAWKNKYLWFFGLFAAFLGNGGEYDFLIRFISGDSNRLFLLDWGKLTQTGVFSWKTFTNIAYLSANDPLTLILVFFVFVVVVVLSVFIVWLSVVSLIAIVNNSAQAFVLKRENFNLGLEAGMKKFWPVFWLSMISRLAIYSFFAFISLFISVAVSQSTNIGSFAYVLAFVVFMPLAIITSFIAKYAIAYVVVRNNKLFKALKNGWDLFCANWLVSTEMAFVLFFINFVVGLAVVLFLLTLFIPFALLLALAKQFAALFVSWFVSIVALIIFLFIVAAVGSWLAVFQISSWTKLFLELESNGVSSKIVRTVNKFLGK
jgi:hypothetical protein